MRWSWEKFERAAKEVFGDDWQTEFKQRANVVDRTIARWKEKDEITNGPVCAMMDAFQRLRRYRMDLP